MTDRFKITLTKEFYNEFRQINPSLVLGLIILTLGLYIINWIYLNNKNFEKVDKQAPDSNRGAIIMMVLPFSWFFIILIFKKIILGPNSLILQIFEIVGWTFIIFLLLKYLLDFCLSFGRITRTQGLFWFIFILTGLIGIISIPIGFYYTMPLSFFLIISIPAMQAELNSFFVRYAIRKEKNIFYN